MAEIQDMAKSLGQALGRTPEYQTLDRAMKSANDDRDMVELKNEIEKMESAFQTVLSQGQQPGQEAVEEYENTIRKLQALSSYQSLVAAQANFEKVMAHVNQSIQAGMVEGAASRIIIPS
ncbi:MAG: YlbF family regulator [Gemmatimonadetes bacterium]|nr:YlbF family regulator [Gemmatimonadota bacterium]